MTVGPNTHYIISGVTNAKLSEVHSTPQFRVGTVAHGNNGSKWMYVQSSAAGTIGQYNLVSIQASCTAAPTTTALAAALHTVGIAQVAFASANYGWVALEGLNLQVSTLDAVAVGVPLFTTDTAGHVDAATASASQHQIQGLVLVGTASGASASNAACVARNLVVKGTRVES